MVRAISLQFSCVSGPANRALSLIASLQGQEGGDVIDFRVFPIIPSPSTPPTPTPTCPSKGGYNGKKPENQGRLKNNHLIVHVSMDKLNCCWIPSGCLVSGMMDLTKSAGVM